MRHALAILLLLLLTIPALAGDGTIRDGKVNLTVYFAFLPTEAELEAWKKLFRDANPLLYRATAGRLRFGETKLTTRASLQQHADCQVQAAATGRAEVVDNPDKGGGLGTKAYIKYFKSDAAEPVTHVHELGHYLFSLCDEYKGQKFELVDQVWKQLLTKDGNIWWDQSGDDWYCASPDDDPEKNPSGTCLMDASQGFKDKRADFCVSGSPEPHVKIRSTDTMRFITDQEVTHQTPCWVQVAAVLGGSVPTAPVKLTANPPDQPTFLRVEQDLYVLLLERTVTEAQLETAKLSARRIIDAAQLPVGNRPGDRLGIVSYDTAGRTVFNVTEMTAANKELARAAVDAITVAEGTGSLTAGLEASLTAMDNQRPGLGDEFSARLITALTTGAGPAVANQTVTELKNTATWVDVVALAETDVVRLQELAAATQGRLTRPDAPPVASQRALDDLETGSTLQFLESIGFDRVLETAGTLPAQPSFTVDAFVEDGLLAIFGDDNLTFELRDPQGRVVQPAEVERGDGLVLIGLENPARGPWTVRLGGTGAYQLHWLGLSPSLAVAVDVPDAVVLPRPLALQVTVAAEATIRGCRVECDLLTPDGTALTLPLFDDGDGRHADAMAHDGTYSTYVADFPVSGVHRCEVRVINVDGTYAAYTRFTEPGPPRSQDPVAAFQRLVQFDFEVEGQGKAVIPPANFRQETGATVRLFWDDANGGATSTRIERRREGGEFGPVALVPPGVNSYEDRPGGGLFYYRAIAVGQGESEPSAVQLVEVTGAPGLGGSGGFIGGEDDGGGFCFIATAAYGTPMAPQVATLRRFRDRSLLTNAPGRAFVRAYYTVSPPIARVIARHEGLRWATRVALTPVVAFAAWPLPCAAALVVMGVLGARRLRKARG